MLDNNCEIFFFNGDFTKKIDYNSIFPENVISVYEVVRIIDRIPLFIEKHYDRLKQSAIRKEILFEIELNVFEDFFYSLILKCKVQNGNIKVLINNNYNTCNLLAYFINHYYPSDYEYEKGVNVGLFQYLRAEPNIKYYNKHYKDKVHDFINKNNLFEILLYDKLGLITEGSKSNVFFIRDNMIFTSSDMYVLKGITRDFVIDICKQNNFEIIFDTVNVYNISDFEAAFITGTSPKVLPISKINEIKFNTDNRILLRIIEDYNIIVNSYINIRIVE